MDKQFFKAKLSPQRVLVAKKLTGVHTDFLHTIFGKKNVEIIIYDPESSDVMPTLIYLTGGPDVTPQLYGEPLGKFTTSDKKRDQLDTSMVRAYPSVPKLGICRGAQFLCVKAGGRLIQHVEGHKEEHMIQTKEDMPPGHFQIFKMSSTHHQMMYPFGIKEKNYKLISWSYKFQGNVYLNGKNNQRTLPDNFLEPEIVYFSNTKALAIQGHPELKTTSPETRDFIKGVILKYLY